MRLEVGGTGKARCSICGVDWPTDCGHEPGKEYEGKTCVQEIYDFNLTEISVVQGGDFLRLPMEKIPAQEVRGPDGETWTASHGRREAKRND